MADNQEIKVTEWDSSKATLMRIDSLIRVCHESNIGRKTLEKKIVYMDATKRLFKELKSKLNEKELSECITKKEKIKVIKKKWGNHLYNPTVTNGVQQNNKFHSIGWNELLDCLDDYEEFMMCCFDKHGMLMKNSRTGLDKFRKGGR